MSAIGREAVLTAWTNGRASKYNYATDSVDTFPERYVLLADQTWGDGSHQTEWDQYIAIIDAARGTHNWKDFFYDIPGNHDAYNDRYFSYYLANSVQGRAAGQTQASWTRVFPFGKYHFLGINSADNTGAGFSIYSPYGDHAGLDSAELSYINQQLQANADAKLTFVFGHHPVTATTNSSDTYLYYGAQDFVHYLGQYQASTYNYGHTHANSQVLFKGNGYTGPESHLLRLELEVLQSPSEAPGS